MVVSFGANRKVVHSRRVLRNSGEARDGIVASCATHGSKTAGLRQWIISLLRDLLVRVSEHAAQLTRLGVRMSSFIGYRYYEF